MRILGQGGTHRDALVGRGYEEEAGARLVERARGLHQAYTIRIGLHRRTGQRAAAHLVERLPVAFERPQVDREARAIARRDGRCRHHYSILSGR